MNKKEKKLNILIVPGIFPFPPNDGGQICVYSFIEFLKDIHDIHVLLPVHNKEQLEIIEIYKKRLNSVFIHVVDFCENDMNMTLDKKIFKLTKSIFFKIKNKYKPTIEPNFFSPQYSDYTTPFSPHLEKYVKKLKEILTMYNFDIVQMEYTKMLNLVSLIPNNVKKIFIEIESRHALLKDYGISKNMDKDFTDYVSTNARILEHTFMSRYDAVFTLNQNDADEIKKSLPNISVYNSPFPVLDKDIITKFNNKAFNVDKLVFMGSENHFPNYDAIEWFINDIFPFINAKDINLLITGNWSSKTKDKFYRINSKIIFTGFVDNLSDILENSISIVPIRLGGGGLRTKIIYAMANNSPVITTSLASIGILGIDDNAFITANTSIEFIEKINKLVTTKEQCKELIEKGKKLVLNNYSQSALGKLRNNYYYDILSL